jgi:hypothetical protein
MDGAGVKATYSAEPPAPSPMSFQPGPFPRFEADTVGAQRLAQRFVVTELGWDAAQVLGGDRSSSERYARRHLVRARR